MDNLNDVLSVGFEIEADGRTWRLEPLRISDYAKLSESIARKRPDPVVTLKRLKSELELDATHLASLIESAYRDLRNGWLVTMDQVVAYLQSPEGVVMKFGLMLKHQHPDITDQQVAAVLAAWERKVEEKFNNRESAQERLQQLDGLPRGNSPGEATNLPNGDASSETSRKRSAGRRSKSAT